MRLLAKVGMAGLVHTYLTQRLHLRYVGFGKKIGLRIPEGTGGLKALGEPIAAGGGNVALKVLSHNVWCHYLQQWYVPSMGVRLHALADAVEREAYHLVLVQELFLLRVGPFAITHEWEARPAPRPSLPIRTTPTTATFRYCSATARARAHAGVCRADGGAGVRGDLGPSGIAPALRAELRARHLLARPVRRATGLRVLLRHRFAAPPCRCVRECRWERDVEGRQASGCA